MIIVQWDGHKLFVPRRNQIWSGFRSYGFVAGVAEEVDAFGCGEGIECRGDGCPEMFDGTGGGLARQRLEFGEDLLDRWVSTVAESGGWRRPLRRRATASTSSRRSGVSV